MANTNTTTSAKSAMTQKEALRRSYDLAIAAGDTDLTTKLEQWLNVLNKERAKQKDSKTIQRESRAKEVAEWINTQGRPFTAAELATSLDGWNVSSETGKVTPQSVSGCMRTAVRMGLVKTDKGGKGGATRYLPLDYVEVEETEEVE